MAERVLASLLDVFKYSCYTGGIRRGHNIPTMGCSGFPDVGLSYFVHIVQIHIANPEQTGARSASSAAMRRIPSCPAFIFPPSGTASLSNTNRSTRTTNLVLPLSGTTSLSNWDTRPRSTPPVGVLFFLPFLSPSLFFDFFFYFITVSIVKPVIIKRFSFFSALRNGAFHCPPEFVFPPEIFRSVEARRA